MYRKRMQIEYDLKNTRNGFGLRHCRSYQADRLNVALLIKFDLISADLIV